MDNVQRYYSKSMQQEKRNQHQQIQLNLSTIFKHKIVDTPQAFGSFYDANGEKYCAISVLSKYLGYDIAVANNDKKDTNPVELIPNVILEMIEDFAMISPSRVIMKKVLSVSVTVQNQAITIIIV